MNTVNVEAKLGVNKFHVDEGTPHIVVTDHPDMAEYAQLMNACPAGLYKRDDAGAVQFDYAGCLECGTCRVLCASTVLAQWRYPRGSMGVDYRYG